MSHQVVWDFVSYSVKKKTKQEKILLLDSFGAARTGEMLGILGPSGCGKSTLLNALGGRISSQGFYAYDGQEVTRGLTTFICQDDLLYDSMTPEEAVKFAVVLRKKMNSEDLKTADELVDHSLRQSNLDHVRNSIIGNPSGKHHISGGERKRVYVATSLQSESAQIVLCDEVTTGLDSFNALEVLKILKQVSRERIVIVVIHQPSLELFYMFDKILLMGNQGKVVYFDSPDNLEPLFENVGLPKPPKQSIQDHAINVVTPQMGVSTEQQLNQLEYVARSNLPNSFENSNADRTLNHKAQQTPPRLTQFRMLIWRNWINLRRNPMFMSLRLFSAIWIGLLTGLVFMNLTRTQSGIRNRQGALIFLLLGTAFSAQQGVYVSIIVLTPVSLIFQLKGEIFKRERYESLYNARTYFLARTITDIPMMLVFPAISVAIAYWMVGLRGGFDRFLLLALLTTLVVASAESLSLLVTAITGSLQVALIVTPNLLVLLMLFSGFFLTLDEVDWFFAWVPPISYIRWAFLGAARNEFDGAEFFCTPEEEINNVCPITDGSQVIDQLGLGPYSIFTAIVFLLTILVSLRILTYLWLEFFVKIKPKGRNMAPEYRP
ncbi:hypothetical protein GEMRC1_007953 [Eukaryota sp. GEM-RC1]